MVGAIWTLELFKVVVAAEPALSNKLPLFKVNIKGL